MDVIAKEDYEEFSDSAKGIYLSLYGSAAMSKLHADNSFYLPTTVRTQAQSNHFERVVSSHVTITTEENTYEFDRQSGDLSSHDYYYLNGERHDVIATPRPSPTPTPKPTATPRPTATPKRTTTTPKPTTDSDPYNARDYSHPDDFYYDYYDDFWDYEDAEDYWEEWND